MRAHLDWLARSGIQEPRDSAEAGGVHAWIDAESGEPAFLYPEITGYFAALAAELSRREPSGGWDERARLAARWLERRAITLEGAVKGRIHASPETARRDPFAAEHGRVCAFDAAIVGLGLLAVHEIDGDETHLRAARSIGRFLVERCSAGDGLDAVFDLANGRPLPPEARWSLHFGPHMAKAALFLAALARIDGDERARATAVRWLDAALARREPNGRFVTDPVARATDLHPHLYAVEGLIGLACELGRGELVLAASRSLAWTFDTCFASEPLLQRWAPAERDVLRGPRTDVLAQALRAHELLLWIDPGSHAIDPRSVTLVQRELARHADPRGGVVYGIGEDGAPRRHVNAWCTMFAVQAELARLDRASGVRCDRRAVRIV